MIKKVLIFTETNFYVVKNGNEAYNLVDRLLEDEPRFVVLDISKATEAELVEIGSYWCHFEFNDYFDIATKYNHIAVDVTNDNWWDIL